MEAPEGPEWQQNGNIARSRGYPAAPRAMMRCVTAQPTIRDVDGEALFLEEAQRASGRRHGSFADHAAARLAAAQQTHGDSWAGRDVDELLGELAEEAADLGSWSALAVQSLALEESLPGQARTDLGDALGEIAALGARAHAVITEVGDVLTAWRRGTA